MGNLMRWQVVANLLKDKPHIIGAEIGVWKGHFVRNIFKLLPGIEKYYAIDAWEFTDEYIKTLRPDGAFIKQNMKDVYDEYIKSTQSFRDNIETLRMTSEEAVNQVPDGSLDFIFIDGNHSYECTRQDIFLWTPKVKKGGLISGHDYGQEQGVNKAVDELIIDFKVGDNFVWYTWR